MTKFSLSQKYYVGGSARTHMRIISARKKRPLGMCVVLCQVPTVCWTSSLSLHDSYYIEFHCPHLMDEKCEGRPRPQSSVWHSQDANPEIQGHCSLVPTTHDCFYVNGLNFFFFFFKPSTSGFTSLHPLVSSAARGAASLSAWMDKDPHHPAPFLTTHGISTHTNTTS